MAIELTIQESKSILSDLLENETIESIPICGYMHNIITARIQNGKVYGDCRERPEHLATVMDMKECSKFLDWDMIAVFSKNPNKASFQDFLSDFCEKRRYDSRPVCVNCLFDSFSEPVRKVLVKNSDGLINVGPFQVMLGKRDSKFDESKRLPDGYYVDILKGWEAKNIVKYWGYDMFPDKEGFFTFAINNLPQNCVRDPNGKPVAWGLEWPYGAGFARYTLPEYRGSSLSYVLDKTRIQNRHKDTPIPFYAGVEFGNEASVKFAQKIGAEKTGRTFYPFFHFPFMRKSKL